MRRPLRSFIVLLAIIAMLALFVALMPRGYDSDLTRIGKGQPTAVLIHDAGFLASTELMESVNGLRNDFEPAILFLVADLGAPQGRRFAEEHSVNYGVLVMFDASGRRVASYSGRADAGGLRLFLEQYRH